MRKAAWSPYVAGLDSDVRHAPSEERLTGEQIGLLRAWIDQGAHYSQDVSRAPAQGALAGLRPLDLQADIASGGSDRHES